MIVDIVSCPRPCKQTGASRMTSTHICALYSHTFPTLSLLDKNLSLLQYFSGDSRDSIVANDDPWESVINPCLNRVIGFGASTHQIADIIRYGPFGINGFYRWIEICMVELWISPELLNSAAVVDEI